MNGVKIKFRISVMHTLISFQIIEMDERFVAKQGMGANVYTALNNMQVRSFSDVSLTEYVIDLWGINTMDRARPTYMWAKNPIDANLIAKRVVDTLYEWSQECTIVNDLSLAKTYSFTKAIEMIEQGKRMMRIAWSNDVTHLSTKDGEIVWLVNKKYLAYKLKPEDVYAKDWIEFQPEPTSKKITIDYSQDTFEF